jgi:LAO/AO transport system kinase
VVVLTPGAGDEVQSVKAGLMEMADVFVLNKADRDGASAARIDLERSVHHLPPDAWKPPIVETVASADQGTEAVWDAICRHRRHLVESGALAERQQRLIRLALRGIVDAELLQRVDGLLGGDQVAASFSQLQSGETNFADAARELLASLLRA